MNANTKAEALALRKALEDAIDHHALQGGSYRPVAAAWMSLLGWCGEHAHELLALMPSDQGQAQFAGFMESERLAARVEAAVGCLPVGMRAEVLELREILAGLLDGITCSSDDPQLTDAERNALVRARELRESWAQESNP